MYKQFYQLLIQVDMRIRQFLTNPILGDEKRTIIKTEIYNRIVERVLKSSLRKDAAANDHFVFFT